jgi:hypothetical protein
MDHIKSRPKDRSATQANTASHLFATTDSFAYLDRDIEIVPIGLGQRVIRLDA